MTDREKRFIELIRNADDPSVAIEEVRKILSFGQAPEREAPRPAREPGHS